MLLALIHATPALALFRPASLTRLYAAVPGETGFALLQHRAALFMLVVIIAVWAAVDPAVRRLAVVTVGFSMISFLVLFARAGRPGVLRPIAAADMMGLLPLSLVFWGAFLQ